MFLPRLIIIFLFAGVLLKSTSSLCIQQYTEVYTIGFLEDEADDVNDENIYLFSVNIGNIIVGNTMINFSEKTIDRPSIIETPPPQFG